jgi:hypothetical protein
MERQVHRHPDDGSPPMTESRLKAQLWIQAAVRTCMAQGISATVARRGDEDAGAILIKQNLGNGDFRVLSQIRTMDGSPAWLQATGADPVEESKADAYIARQIDRDWDLWIIEIEDRQGRLPFDAPIL